MCGLGNTVLVSFFPVHEDLSRRASSSVVTTAIPPSATDKLAAEIDNETGTGPHIARRFPPP
jgi:hypothetical protein